MEVAGHSRWPALALHPATPGTGACNSPGSDCPACISTARAHLGEQPPETSTAQPGSRLVLRGIPWDNRLWPLTSHEVSRLPLELVWPWPQKDTGHPCSALSGQPLPRVSTGPLYCLAGMYAGTCYRHGAHAHGSLHPHAPRGLSRCHTSASAAVLVGSVLDSWWFLSQLIILGIAITAAWRKEVWGHPPNMTLLHPP